MLRAPSAVKALGIESEGRGGRDLLSQAGCYGEGRRSQSWRHTRGELVRASGKRSWEEVAVLKSKGKSPEAQGRLRPY